MSTDELDAIVHVAGALLGLGALVLALRAADPRRRRAAFVAVMLAGLFAFPGIDRLRGRNFLHPPELFHYVFGAKYFPELGYTGLYDAAALAVKEQGLPEPLKVRDLTEAGLGPASFAHYRARRDFRPRFSAERWQQLRDDMRRFHAATGTSYARAMTDHGFNGTPAWIALARAVERDAPITHGRLYAYATIDVVLLVVLLAILLSVFGLEQTAIAALFVGSAWTFRFAWTGGSFLRYDWVFTLGLSLAALRKERFGLAGGLLAWSTMARLFPAFFALAAGFSLLFRARDRAGRLSLARFVLGFALVAGLGLAAGSNTGRGTAAWTEFGNRIRTHHAAWASNHVGLDTIAIVDAAFTSRAPAGLPPDEAFEAYVAPIEYARTERRPYLRLVLLAAVAAIAFAARRLPPWKAMPLGAVAVFSASAISGYYWIMLLVVPFVSPRRTSILLVSVTPLACAIEILGHNMIAGHVAVSVAYLLIFVDWIVSVLRAPVEVSAEEAST